MRPARFLPYYRRILQLFRSTLPDLFVPTSSDDAFSFKEKFTLVAGAPLD
jgi:hypothetical protein